MSRRGGRAGGSLAWSLAVALGLLLLTGLMLYFLPRDAGPLVHNLLVLHDAVGVLSVLLLLGTWWLHGRSPAVGGAWAASGRGLTGCCALTLVSGLILLAPEPPAWLAAVHGTLAVLTVGVAFVHMVLPRLDRL